MLIGYIRVSTTDQNPARQIEKMRALGIEERYIFMDKQTGRNFDRPAYVAMKTILREGDVIYIDSIDRLGRDYDKIITEWKHITRELNCDIIALDNEQLFNSKLFKEMGDIGKLMEDQFLSLFAYVAAAEIKKIHERQKAGIAIAKKEGKYKGRKMISYNTNEFEKLYIKWRSGEITAVDFQEKINLKPNTFYRRIKDYESEL